MDLHRAQVRISLRGLVFSEPFYPTWDLHSSKTKKKKLKRRDSAQPVEQLQNWLGQKIKIRS